MALITILTLQGRGWLVSSRAGAQWVHSSVVSWGSLSLSWPGQTLPRPELCLGSPQAGNGRGEKLPFFKADFMQL